tara:strand:+ start:189 stop:365 length:177 start_codon:yes stop_codon:yes gene_type:complete
MKSDITSGIDKAMKNAGILEYTFGILATISIMPVALTYFVLVRLIIQPIGKLFKKIWK